MNQEFPSAMYTNTTTATTRVQHKISIRKIMFGIQISVIFWAWEFIGQRWRETLANVNVASNAIGYAVCVIYSNAKGKIKTVTKHYQKNIVKIIITGVGNGPRR